ncbi:MAG: metal-dependent hydrolase [Anaerolineae bacterium]|nr:metal-dependent hydrolase [Anaerolineae bacterium]NIN99460.1 metal-dependent hydrolase [Anaerolineae bacterium]NIQ82325.1 metal-dependent hydrolase [Anaerolineae bacterium]
MTAVLTYHGHACFSVEGAGKTIWLDPFLSGNPQAEIQADDVKDADYILVSHGHGDHLGDAVPMAQKTGATIISNHEIASYCQEQEVAAHGLHIGGGYQFPFGRVKMTIAHHGCSLPDGSCGGNPGGFLFDIEDKRIYFAADTALFYDMKLLGEEKAIDVALLPIGDNYTMGPDDALKAVQLLTPRLVIPMHYNTFDVIEQDPHAFANRVKASTEADCAVLSPGGSISL